MWPEGVKRREGAGKVKKKKKKGAAVVADNTRQRLLGLLEERQRTEGFLSEDSLSEIAAHLNLTLSEVYGVASFYSFLSTRPRGKHVIRICKGLPCSMKHAAMVRESIEKQLGVAPGVTTADGMFSFELTNCIGACDQAPAMLVDDTLYGNLNPGKIADILKSYR